MFVVVLGCLPLFNLVVELMLGGMFEINMFIGTSWACKGTACADGLVDDDARTI